MKYIDLHVHSTCSDGTVTPTELVDLAVKQGLSAFALTDHDTLRGIPEAKKACELYQKQGTDIHVIPGVEISAAFKKADIHILGLNVDLENKELIETLDEAELARDNRNRKMADNLAGAGLDISYEKVLALDPKAVITRAHFAKYLVKKGYVATNKEAFNKYLHTKSPYYVCREYLPPETVITLILNAGGVPVLAHPLLYHLPEEELRKLVAHLKECGLKGLEAIYTRNSRQDEDFSRRLAKENGLLISGGSDFHGTNKPDIQMGVGTGNLQIPFSLLDELGISL
jgi:hypothetical protein